MTLEGATCWTVRERRAAAGSCGSALNRGCFVFPSVMPGIIFLGRSVVLCPEWWFPELTSPSVWVRCGLAVGAHAVRLVLGQHTGSRPWGTAQEPSPPGSHVDFQE